MKCTYRWLPDTVLYKSEVILSSKCFPAAVAIQAIRQKHTFKLKLRENLFANKLIYSYKIVSKFWIKDDS